MQIALKTAPERLCLRMGNRRVAVTIRRDMRARRMILRVDAASGQPVLTLPSRTGLRQAETFLSKHLDWLKSHLVRLPDPTPFDHGSEIPLRGKPARITHRRGRGVACCVATDTGREILIRGEREHLARRVLDYLKREARRDIEAAVRRHATALGKQPTQIRIGDAKTRWGSCNSKGGLTFSWRLILAPAFVLDYLAAHEVAHLKEMNHGPRFWALVAKLDPDYERAQDWLRKFGAELHAVGRAR
jgi:hypothetical protein